VINEAQQSVSENSRIPMSHITALSIEHFEVDIKEKVALKKGHHATPVNKMKAFLYSKW
jgi:hypothetical protein